MLNQTDSKLSIAVFRSLQAMGISFAFIEKIEKWANCLFVRLRVNSYKRRALFVSYSSVQSVPTASGEYTMIEGDRRLRVEVDLVSSGELSTFVVRSIEPSPRVWEFHALNGELTRAFDWNGDLVPREVLRGIAFEAIPPASPKWVDLVLSPTRKNRIRNEFERVNG